MEGALRNLPQVQTLEWNGWVVGQTIYTMLPRCLERLPFMFPLVRCEFSHIDNTDFLKIVVKYI